MKKKFKDAVPYILSIVFVFLFWIIVSKVQNDQLFFPSPKKVFTTFFGLLGQRAFYGYITNTLIRVIISFAVSLLLAIIFAWISKNSSFFRRMLYPLILLARAVPTISVIFLCYMWFSPQLNPIIICSLIIFPTLYGSFLNSFLGVDKDIEEMCDIFKVDKKTRFFEFYLPQVIGRVYDDGKNAFSLSIKLVIAAEALSSTSDSLGMIMNLSKSYLEIDKLFAITIVTVIMGLFADLILYAIKAFVIWWNYVRAKKHN